MSDRFGSLAKQLHEAAADAAWVQWHALGGQVAARTPTSIVDPEALLLATLALAEGEPRLQDMLYGFMGADTRRISIQRLRRLAATFPERVPTSLGHLASGVVERDARWRRLAAGSPMSSGRPGKVGSAGDRLREPASLMLRMRAVFGVDVRADVVTYLLGSQGDAVSLRTLKAELGYVTNSLRGACDSLTEAGLLFASTTRPTQFRVRWPRWQKFFELSMTPWVSWAATYALTFQLHDWLAKHQGRDASAGARRMLAREWQEEHAHQLQLLDVDVGDERGWSFEELVEMLTHRLTMSA